MSTASLLKHSTLWAAESLRPHHPLINSPLCKWLYEPAGLIFGGMCGPDAAYERLLIISPVQRQNNLNFVQSALNGIRPNWPFFHERTWKILICRKWYGLYGTRIQTKGSVYCCGVPSRVPLQQRVSPYQFNHVNGDIHNKTTSYMYTHTRRPRNKLSVTREYTMRREIRFSFHKAEIKLGQFRGAF